MTFISFAENFEDVMLWRALHSQTNAIYIDVGAADPVMHSVTNTFYQRGWRGINIEPNPQYFPRLHEQRPEDVNLSLLVGEADATSLAAVCRAHAAQPIGFLRVDAGPATQAVLAGADWTRFRPHVVVVKTVRRFSQPLTGDHWPAVLDGAGYRPLYFDGINRFFAAAEHHAALAPAFAVPPNALDDFIRSDEAAARLMQETQETALQAVAIAERRVARANHEMTRAEWRIAQVRLDARRMWERDIGRKDLDLAEKDVELASRAARLAASEHHVQALQAVVHTVYNSTTWKLGRPMRLLTIIARRIRRLTTRPSGPAIDAVEAPPLPLIKATNAAAEPDYQPAVPLPPPAAVSRPARPRASHQEAALIGRLLGTPPGL